MQSSVDILDESLRDLFHFLKSRSSWKKISLNANVDIDRPSMAILHILLKNSPEKLKLMDVASLLEIEAPYISRKITELVDQGFIQKSPDPKDKRASYLIPTLQAKQIDNRINKARYELIQNAIASWSPLDAQKFGNYHKKFVNDLIKNNKEFN